jgi:circadian clock protein KaiC
MATATRPAPSRAKLPKAPTGIAGLDDITDGGLPRGRPTLVCGGAGSGKTLLSTEFLVRGALRFGEPGVFVAFEETPLELTENVESLGFTLGALVSSGKIIVEHVHVDRGETAVVGAFSLDGLFSRLGNAIDTVKAKRVVLDSLENLFAGLDDEAILRSELVRLFRWLKERRVTAVVTAEAGSPGFTRHGLEEYLSDCVIVLDHRVHNQFATRRMRILKYRGSRHGTDEYPFIVGRDGLSVLPITAVGLTHTASSARIPSGVPRLDTMLGGKGYYAGSSILVSGTAGTGKTSISAHLADATCGSGSRCLMFLFEESPDQFLRNAASIGISLSRWIAKGLLTIHSSRPSLYGLENHLVAMHDLVEAVKPAVVVVDPITNLTSGDSMGDARSMLTRLIDFMKMKQVTALFTSLTSGGPAESSDAEVSSLMDTWLLLRDVETNGERNRLLYILKSRGMAHSNQVREFQLTNNGVRLLDVYVGPQGVLTGTARLAQQAREGQAGRERERESRKSRLESERRVTTLRSQIAALKEDLALAEEERDSVTAGEASDEENRVRDQADMAAARHADDAGREPRSRREVPRRTGRGKK